MYTKVHNKGNRWFRDDNNTFIGEEIPKGPKLNALKALYGDHIIISKQKGEYIVVFHGYFDKNNNFFLFCRKTICRHCANGIRVLSCPKSYADNPSKSKTGGYYILTTWKEKEKDFFFLFFFFILILSIHYM